MSGLAQGHAGRHAGENVGTERTSDPQRLQCRAPWPSSWNENAAKRLKKIQKCTLPILEMLQRSAVLNATVQAGAGRGQKVDADATRSGRAAEGQFVYDCRHSTFRLAADVARERQKKAERAERERGKLGQLDPGERDDDDERLRRDQVLYDSKTSSFYPLLFFPPAGIGSNRDEGGREAADSVTAGSTDADRKRQDAER